MPYMEDLEHDAMMDEVMHDDPRRERDYDAEVEDFLDGLDMLYALTSDMEDPA